MKNSGQRTGIIRFWISVSSSASYAPGTAKTIQYNKGKRGQVRGAVWNREEENRFS